MRVLADEMRNAAAASREGRGGLLSAEDVAGAVQFEKLLGSKEAAETALKKLDPKQRKLLEQVSKENANGTNQSISIPLLSSDFFRRNCVSACLFRITEIDDTPTNTSRSFQTTPLH